MLILHTSICERFQHYFLLAHIYWNFDTIKSEWLRLREWVGGCVGGCVGGLVGAWVGQ